MSEVNKEIDLITNKLKSVNFKKKVTFKDVNIQINSSTAGVQHDDNLTYLFTNLIFNLGI